MCWGFFFSKMMGVTKALQALLIWASPVAAALATAAEVQPRSTNLATVLETLESDIPTCAVGAAGSRACGHDFNHPTVSMFQRRRQFEEL